MLADLIGDELARLVGDEKGIMEIRMRVNRVLIVIDFRGNRREICKGGAKYIVRAKDIENVLARATNLSFYSASDEMKKGYIPCKHYRIGVGGEGISENGVLLAIKHVAFLVIRIPHQIFGVADSVIGEIVCKNGIKNTLVVSPTGGGKTTFLRELARLVSYTHNVVVIDERYELCAMAYGEPSLDIGDADVISGVPKTCAYESAVRAMNPDVIVTDELFGAREIGAILDVMRCGVKVFASVHANSVDSLRNGEYASLVNAFDMAIVLGKNPVGKIIEKVRL